jgi:CHAT domain-containing protein
VVASLWQVSDRATAALMGDYFRRIATMETRDYSAELFAAKQAIGRPGPWRDPYYWAPFVLSGER